MPKERSDDLIPFRLEDIYSLIQEKATALYQAVQQITDTLTEFTFANAIPFDLEKVKSNTQQM